MKFSFKLWNIKNQSWLKVMQLQPVWRKYHNMNNIPEAKKSTSVTSYVPKRLYFILILILISFLLFFYFFFYFFFFLLTGDKKVNHKLKCRSINQLTTEKLQNTTKINQLSYKTNYASIYSWRNILNWTKIRKDCDSIKSVKNAQYRQNIDKFCNFHHLKIFI